MAEALGYDQFDRQGQRCTIGLAQYSRRLKELGLWLYFLRMVLIGFTS